MTPEAFAEIEAEARDFVGIADAGERTTNRYEWCRQTLSLLAHIRAQDERIKTLETALEPFAEMARRWLENEIVQRDVQAGVAHYEHALDVFSAALSRLRGGE